VGLKKYTAIPSFRGGEKTQTFLIMGVNLKKGEKIKPALSHLPKGKLFASRVKEEKREKNPQPLGRFLSLGDSIKRNRGMATCKGSRGMGENSLFLLYLPLRQVENKKFGGGQGEVPSTQGAPSA